jgi:hypothetical protein
MNATLCLILDSSSTSGHIYNVRERRLYNIREQELQHGIHDLNNLKSQTPKV